MKNVQSGNTVYRGKIQKEIILYKPRETFTWVNTVNRVGNTAGNNTDHREKWTGGNTVHRDKIQKEPMLTKWTKYRRKQCLPSGQNTEGNNADHVDKIQKEPVLTTWTKYRRK